EMKARRDELMADGGYRVPESQTPWQQYFREMVQPFSEGMTLRDAPDYQDVASKFQSKLRNNH
ncbi:MAG: dihydroxy-acid dehydratase, partial [Pseudomonadota bacterium]